MQIDGRYHCGRVTYRAEIDPAKVSICHCTDSQSLTVICSADDFRPTGAALKIYGKRGDNGRIRYQHFCDDCGSPLFTSGDGGPDDFGIRWGSIGQRGELRPVRQIWCRSAAPWINDLGGLPGKATE